MWVKKKRSVERETRIWVSVFFILGREMTTRGMLDEQGGRSFQIYVLDVIMIM